MAANGWVITYPNKEDYMESRNDVIYYFDANGQIEHNAWIHDEIMDVWQYAKADGRRARLEWLTINGKKYYFDINGNMAANGWVITYPNKEDYMESRNAVEYYFDVNGQIVR